MALVSPLPNSHPLINQEQITALQSPMWRRETQQFITVLHGTTLLKNVDAVILLTQTPAVHTVSTGQQVVLNCNIQRYDNAYVSWYKQVPGEAPQFVLGFYFTSSSLIFGSGFSSDRFNSKASSNTDYQFIINRAERGDSAVYYCRTWDNSAKEHVSQ
uniref:Ig-like domain-containing protein n=1 Tax=Sparus aurata TaxID=8175 RepID=A0A671X759_SPAAU